MMLRRLPVLLTIGGLLLVTAHLLAQSQANQAIPACSKDEITEVLRATQIDPANLDKSVQDSPGFVQFLRSADKPTLERLLGQLDEGQRLWWSENATKMPRCSLALEVTHLIGQELDELLIAVSLMSSGHKDLAEAHLEQYPVLVKRQVELIKEALRAGEAAPTAVPTTSADAQTVGMKPKAGKWAGKGVTFEITNAGNIANFETFIQYPPNKSCRFALEQIPVEADGTFVFSYTIEKSKIDQGFLAMAEAVDIAPEPTITASGEIIELQRVSGKFDTDTHVTGIKVLLLCGGELNFTKPSENPWSAEWKSL